MKKILTALLTTMLIISSLSCVVLADTTGTCGNLSYSISNNEVTITGCNTSASGGLTIPSTISGYPVTSIGDKSFYNCESLTSITIPNSVTSIGNEAFYGCSSLTSIIIPNSVTSIGEAFAALCYNLINIDVDENNDNFCSIDGNLYSKDKKMFCHYAYGKKEETFILPAGVEVIGNRAIYRTETYPKKVILSNTVTTISDYAFAVCRSLEQIVLPNSLKTIGDCSFIYCSNLRSLTIPEGVTNVSKSGMNIPKLEYVNIPKSVIKRGPIGTSTNVVDVYYSGTEADWNNITRVTSADENIVLHFEEVRADFVNQHDSGYFSSNADDTFKEGVISFTTQIPNLYSFTSSDIDLFGMYIYKTGTSKSNRTKITSVSGQDLIDNKGWFYSFVTEIPLANFSNEIHALPYIIVNGETYFGDVISATVDGTNDFGDITTKPSFLQ